MVTVGSRRFVLVSCEICEISLQVLDVDAEPFMDSHMKYHRERGELP